MQNEELLELTASEKLTLDQEYNMQNSWFEDKDKCTYIILDKLVFENTKDEVDAMIGDVNLYLNDPDDPKAAEIEVMIADPIHRRKGKGKEALLFMLRYGMEMLGITKFTAKIKMTNYKSQKLFNCIGFNQTGQSDYFQEVELTCQVTDCWKLNLLKQTQVFNKEEL